MQLFQSFSKELRDFDGVPVDLLKRNIDLIGTEILPAIKKYTAKN